MKGRCVTLSNDPYELMSYEYHKAEKYACTDHITYYYPYDIHKPKAHKVMDILSGKSESLFLPLTTSKFQEGGMFLELVTWRLEYAKYAG